MSIFSKNNSLKEKVFFQLAFRFPQFFKQYEFREMSRLNWRNIDSVKGSEPEFLLVKALAPKDKVIFDIGANKGYYIYFLEEVVEPEQIYAFEPIPFLNKKLSKFFPHSNIFNIALSDTDSQQQFKIPIVGNQALNTRATLETEFREENESEQEVFDVQTMKLDTFVQKYQIDNLGLVKIDVEGHEMKVLKGAENTLKKMRPTLFVEIEERHHPNLKVSEVLEYVNNMGYQSFYFHQAKKELLSTDQLSESKVKVHNYIFLSNEKDTEEIVSKINRHILTI